MTIQMPAASAAPKTYSRPGTIRVSTLASLVFCVALFSLGLPFDQGLGRFSQRAAGVLADSSGGARTVTLWITLYGLAGLLILRAWRSASEVMGRSVWYLLLLLYLGVSLVWSRNGPQGMELFLGMAGSSAIGLMAAVRYRDNPRLLVGHAAAALGLAQMGNLVLNLFFPSLSLDPNNGRWVGFYGSANYLGSLASFTVLLSALAVVSHSKLARKFYIATLFAGLANLYGSGSATSIVTTLAGLLVLFAWGPLTARGSIGLLWRVFALLALTAFLILNYVGIVDQAVEYVLQLLGKNSNLSGRSKIWAEAAPYISAQPIFGYGLGSRFELSSVFGLSDLHSGYLSLMYQGGLTAILLLALSAYAALARSLRYLAHNDLSSRAVFYLIFATLIYNVSESSIFSPRSPGFIILATMIFLAATLVSSRKKTHG